MKTPAGKASQIAAVTTHGMSYSSEYKVWAGMKGRCADKKQKSHGGRGITVCERWQSFENFYADMGPRPSDKHSIERIDNDGNYEPSNCRWATLSEQMRNTRRNRIVEFRGEKRTISEWAVITGLTHKLITWRLNNGWPAEDALTTPNVGRKVKKRKSWCKITY